MILHRLVRTVLSTLLMIGLFASVGAAQTWTGPDTSRRTYMFGHAIENFDFAITEMCLPYMLQDAEAIAWSRRRGVAPFPAGGPFAGLSAYLVGGGSGAIVGVGNRFGHRECTIKGESAEADRYAAAAESRLTPLGFVRAPDELFPAATSGQRRHYCGPIEGKQLIALVTIRDDQFLLTILELGIRDPRCSDDGDGTASSEGSPPESD